MVNQPASARAVPPKGAFGWQMSAAASGESAAATGGQRPGANAADASGTATGPRAGINGCSNLRSIGEIWWSQAESNRRPLECHSSALPTELWPHSAGLLGERPGNRRGRVGSPEPVRARRRSGEALYRQACAKTQALMSRSRRAFFGSAISTRLRRPRRPRCRRRSGRRRRRRLPRPPPGRCRHRRRRRHPRSRCRRRW